MVRSSSSKAKPPFSLDPLPLPFSSPSHSDQISIDYFSEIDLVKVTNNFHVAKTGAAFLLAELTRGEHASVPKLFLQVPKSLFGLHLLLLLHRLCWVLLLCLTFKCCSALQAQSLLPIPCYHLALPLDLYPICASRQATSIFKALSVLTPAELPDLIPSFPHPRSGSVSSTSLST